MGAVQLGQLQAEGQGGRMTDAGFIDKLFDTIAKLLEEPKTARDLIEITGYKADTIYNYLERGCAMGVIYIHDFVHPKGSRQPQARYAVQVKPFDRVDATPP